MIPWRLFILGYSSRINRDCTVGTVESVLVDTVHHRNRHRTTWCNFVGQELFLALVLMAVLTLSGDGALSFPWARWSVVGGWVVDVLGVWLVDVL